MERDPRIDPQAGDQVLAHGRVHVATYRTSTHVFWRYIGEKSQGKASLGGWRERVAGGEIIHPNSEKPKPVAIPRELFDSIVNYLYQRKFSGEVSERLYDELKSLEQQ